MKTFYSFSSDRNAATLLLCPVLCSRRLPWLGHTMAGQGPGSSSTWRGLLQLREPPYLDLTFSLALNCHIGFYRWHLQAPDLYHILQVNLCANFRLWILTHRGASKSLALSELRSSFKGIILHPTESSRWVTGNLMSTEWIRITTWPPLRISLWVRDDDAYRNRRETLLKRPADPHMPGIQLSCQELKL